MNDTTSPTLLVIDDNIGNVKVLLKLLDDAGFKVLVAKDGLGGFKKIEYTSPDLILLDVIMPGMNGFEVCQQLKSQEKTRDIPVIFMTALVDTADKIKGFKLGAADYITKPFQHEEVLARINTHLSIRKLQQKLQTRNRQLQTQTRELEQRNMELDAFAHTVAHDLKNPLSAVVGLSCVLKNNCSPNTPPDTKSIKRLQLVEQAGQQAMNTVESLLLLAGVSRQAPAALCLLDMSSIITKVIEQSLAYMIEQYQGKIELAHIWPKIKGYEPWIEEMWINYVTNGLKYGGKPPHLKLGTDIQNDNMIRFWVRDNGHGLTTKEQALLFTPFSRLHQIRAEGHGLGLSIVHQIAEKLGGKVGVESTVGQGSLFYFTLPIN
ncbi:response regulator [Candidatus Parabeggiatoa sp. HSG14]|uniref:response regulator n=1 Tax=Candidatus Parabeggiatoa sp. HSG14 TaxID=3055593 RepID=UPI0025A6E26B|nr:response regulator [Thiotrichales bacterium HSG14]